MTRMTVTIISVLKRRRARALREFSAAAAVIGNMDQTVDPCDDFYQFACGNFIKETIIDDDKTTHTTFSVISDSLLNKLRMIVTEPVRPDEQKPFKMAKLLYKSCMDKGERNDNDFIEYVLYIFRPNARTPEPFRGLPRTKRFFFPFPREKFVFEFSTIFFEFVRTRRWDFCSTFFPIR